MISKKQIDLLADTISNKFKTKRIYLLGSYAYGKPDYESDLDICVITKFNGKRKIDIIRDIRREVGQNFNIPIDILLYEDKEFIERSALHNTLEHKILKNGILING